MTSTTDPLNNVTVLTYDPASNVATRTDANGKMTTFTHDVLNRLTGITYAATATSPVTFAYDANGNRTAMTDGAGTESFAYDSLDRLTSDTRAADTFAYAFDAASNLTGRTYPDGTVTTYTYDDDGRMASAASGGTTTTYAYDVAGNLVTTTTPDGFTARNTFDAAGRLTEVANVGAAGVLSRFTYALDPVGNRIQATSTRSNVLYTYDLLDRITKVCYASCTTSGGGSGGTAAATLTAGASLDCLACGGGGSVPNGAPIDNPPAAADTFTRWTYDAVGNRLTEVNYLGTTTYAYDAADRLTSTTAPASVVTTATYDAVGNQLSAGATTYAYDLADRLISASVGSTTETYTWTGDGIRRSSATGPQATKTTGFVVDRTLGAGNVVAERTGNGALLRRYVYGLDLLAQTTSNKGPYWYHHDGLGSVTDITSSTGSPLAWTEYTPFGTVRAAGATSQAPTNPFRFTGAYQDGSTALYHLRARQYDPTTGRFTSTDPLSPGIGDPYVGAYVYARNNPARYVDPSGRESQPAGGWNAGVLGNPFCKSPVAGLPDSMFCYRSPVPSITVPDPTEFLYTLSAAATGGAVFLAATGVGAVPAVVFEGIGLLSGAAATALSCNAGKTVDCAVGIAGTAAGAGGIGSTVLGATRVISRFAVGFGLDYDALAAGLSLLSALKAGFQP